MTIEQKIEAFEGMMWRLIAHGGDSGGPYIIFPDGLEEYCDKIKNELGLNEYEIDWNYLDARFNNLHYCCEMPHLIKK